MELTSSDGFMIKVSRKKYNKLNGYFDVLDNNKSCALEYDLLNYIFNKVVDDDIEKMISYIPILCSLNLIKKACSLCRESFDAISFDEIQLLIKVQTDIIRVMGMRNLMKSAMGIYLLVFGRIHILSEIKIKKILLKSCAHDYIRIVQYLHENGVDIQMDDNAAIKKASEYGHLEIVNYLHKNGADICAEFNEPIKIASYNGHLEVVRYLHENGASIYPKKHPILNNHLDDSYLHENEDNNDNEDNDDDKDKEYDQDHENDTPIILASENGHYEVVRYLHQKGADICANYNKPIILASKNGHYEIVRYLHQNGADMRANYDMPLSKAIRWGHLKVICYLYKNGAQINYHPDFQEEYYCDTIEYLLENCRDMHGKSRGEIAKIFKTVSESV